jgi:hypothetical protein
MDPDEPLGEAWRRFSERIAALGAVVTQEGAPTSARERAEGYRYLARLVTANLDQWIRRGDPDDPRVLWLNDSWGLPNADAVYTTVPLRGDGVYEVTGQRGSVHWLNFQLTAGWFGTDQPMRVVSEVSGHEIAVAEDGRFRLVLGGPEQKSNWLPMAPDASALTIRQFFYDWDGETRAEVAIRRQGGGPGPAPLAPATIAERLDRTASVIEAIAELFPKRAIAGRTHMANAFSAPAGAGNQLGINRNVYSGGHFVLGPDEALVVEVTPPACIYWGIQLGSFWMEPIDFANHQSSLNGRQAVLDPDGVFRAVVSARDPGVPNWLDTTGLPEGTMLIRWLGCDTGPRPTTRKLPFDEALRALPASTPRVSPDERTAAIERRRAHVARRYR